MDWFLPPAAFIDFGGPEMVLIMVIALILFGGKRMPEFARGLGKAIREFKKAAGDVEHEIKRVIDEAEKSAPLPPKPFAANPRPVITPPPEVQEHGPSQD
jgi:sec-independent protein translocase protein TatA